jgi:hypothetical protein
MSTPTPYQVALNWIEKNPGTAGAAGLAKVVLSLCNSECSYSFRECIRSFDDSLTALSVRLIEHFAEHGEDEELVRVGYRVHELYPRLWDAGQKMQDARARLEREWERADRAKAEKLDLNN